MLDVSYYNAYELWTKINPTWNAIKRRLFLEELGKSLINEHIRKRSHNPRTEETLNIVKKVQEEFLMGVYTSSDTIEKQNRKRRRYTFCERSIDVKTNITCENCKRHVSKNHAINLCPKCND